jgi:hypothetical protein
MIYEHDNAGTLTLIEDTAGTVLDDIRKLLTEANLQLIVELGTYRGGMVKHYSEWFPAIPVYSFDIDWMISSEDAKLFQQRKVSIVIGNVLNDDQLLPILLSQQCSKMLFVDNGNREVETRNYAGYLRPGDILGFHDWTRGECTFVRENPDIILQNFEPTWFNEKCDKKDGYSDCRFFVRKSFRDKSSDWKPAK